MTEKVLCAEHSTTVYSTVALADSVIVVIVVVVVEIVVVDSDNAKLDQMYHFTHHDCHYLYADLC